MQPALLQVYGKDRAHHDSHASGSYWPAAPAKRRAAARRLMAAAGCLVDAQRRRCFTACRPRAVKRNSAAAMEAEFDDLFILVLIGDSGAGKSALLNRYAGGTFEDRYI